MSCMSQEPSNNGCIATDAAPAAVEHKAVPDGSPISLEKTAPDEQPTARS